MRKYNFNEDCPVFDGLFDYCRRGCVCVVLVLLLWLWWWWCVCLMGYLTTAGV
jgi:hypothetical protein